jgi:cell volume regulation protein A
MVIAIGFVADYFFRRTGIPDLIFLVLLGFLMGPILKVVDPASLVGIAPLFSALAITIILFDGGLNLELYKVFEQSPRASLLAVVSILFSMGVSTLFAVLVLRWEPLSGLLLGTMLGGSSSSIVLPLLRRVRVGEKVSTLLNLESVYTDAITIVVSLILIQMLSGAAAGDETMLLARGIASAFAIGVVLGVLSGLVWIKVLSGLKEEPYQDILTLCIVLIVYAGCEAVGGNGAIAALVFGLTLGNGKTVANMFRMREAVEASDLMRRFQGQMSFLMRTFFYAYLGIIAVVENYMMFAYGAMIATLILISRYVATYLASARDRMLRDAVPLMTIMLPRGLAAAVVAQLPLLYQLPHAEAYPALVFPVILFTVLICTVGTFLYARGLMGRPVLSPVS